LIVHKTQVLTSSPTGKQTQQYMQLHFQTTQNICGV